MTKIECLKRYLIRCCYWYYVKSDSLIPDRTYDMLLKDLEQREKRRGFADPDSPTQMIWGDREEYYVEDWMKSRDDIEVCAD